MTLFQGVNTALVTQLLNEVRVGKRASEPELAALIYRELHKIASRQMRSERPGHTLQATALVHEAYLRLTSQEQAWENRAHFFALAAQLMHSILVDYARKRQAAKRGGDIVRVDLEGAGIPVKASADQILDLNRAIEKLAAWDPRQAKIVVFRFFGGLNEEEIADVLEISPRTVKRDWKMARAWLHKELGDRRPSQHDG